MTLIKRNIKIRNSQLNGISNSWEFICAQIFVGFKFYCRQVPSTASNVSASTSTDTTVLEITFGHWPFSDQFQQLADQNQF